jgi:hypothetical protein
MMFSPGQIMGLIGGAPVVKSGDVIVNKLKCAKVMEPGDMSGILEKGLPSGLLSSIMNNPTSGKASKAASQASQGSDQLSNVARGQITKSAIDDDFFPALDDFTNAAAELVGLGSDPLGLLNTIGHAQVLDSLSRGDPALSSDKLLGPAYRDDALETAGNVIENSVRDVLDHKLEDHWAAQLIQEQVAILRSIMNDSEWAKSQAEDMAGFQASISIMAAMLVSSSPIWRNIAERTFQPEILAEAQKSNKAWLTVDDGDQVVNT